MYNNSINCNIDIPYTHNYVFVMYVCMYSINVKYVQYIYIYHMNI